MGALEKDQGRPITTIEKGGSLCPPMTEFLASGGVSERHLISGAMIAVARAAKLTWLLEMRCF